MSEMTVPKQTHGQKILGILRAKSLGLRAETLEAHHTSQDAQRFETVPKTTPHIEIRCKRFRPSDLWGVSDNRGP